MRDSAGGPNILNKGQTNTHGLDFALRTHQESACQSLAGKPRAFGGGSERDPVCSELATTPVHRGTGWPRPSRLPSLSLNQAALSPTPLLG